AAPGFDFERQNPGGRAEFCRNADRVNFDGIFSGPKIRKIIFTGRIRNLVAHNARKFAVSGAKDNPCAANSLRIRGLFGVIEDAAAERAGCEYAEAGMSIERIKGGIAKHK